MIDLRELELCEMPGRVNHRRFGVAVVSPLADVASETEGAAMFAMMIMIEVMLKMIMMSRKR